MAIFFDGRVKNQIEYSDGNYLEWNGDAMGQVADLSWVNLRELDPTLIIDIRYATPNNFLHRAVYPAPVCVARKVVGESIKAAQSEFQKHGLGLKIFDCYRPLSVQKIMWELFPNPLYIANPANGSRHNRGAAVDLTLVDSKGEELMMPSDYDHFGVEAHRNFDGGSKQARDNRDYLQSVMVAQGFIPFATEWWHFDHRDWAMFPVEDLPLTSF